MNPTETGSKADTPIPAQDIADIEQKLGAMRADYARQVPGKLAQIEDTWQEVRAEGGRWLEALAAMRHMAHALTGSGATFGYSGLSRTAHLLEMFLKSMVDAAAMPSPEQQVQVNVLLAELGQAAERPDPVDETATLARHRTLQGRQRTTNGAYKLVYLVEGDRVAAGDMAAQIGHFGYVVRCIEQLGALAEQVKQEPPDVIVMNLAFLHGEFAEAEAIAAMLQEDNAPPVIFISSRHDLAARLQAVRAGGSAYFVQPVDVGILVDKLDALTTIEAMEPYRVLILEDSPALGAFYAYTLQQAGMTVQLVMDPMQVMEVLNEFQPELILMDLFMPEVNGEELAQVIRQEEAFVGVPIIFLSPESDPDRQLEVLNLGVDDLFPKPIWPRRLILSVVSRVARYRVLRSFMTRDSLTGLLNHTKTKEQLDIEFDRASRHDHMLAFAMIDIDHFKRVNDTYGHQVGDRVIKSLTRMLQQRLRRTDVIGRYGGEEFAVIMTDTDGPSAFRVVEDIREGFSKVRHYAEQKEFTVTFSCGIAAYPGVDTAAELNGLADKALYQAKREGRNRTVLAG